MPNDDQELTNINQLSDTGIDPASTAPIDDPKAFLEQLKRGQVRDTLAAARGRSYQPVGTDPGDVPIPKNVPLNFAQTTPEQIDKENQQARANLQSGGVDQQIQQIHQDQLEQMRQKVLANVAAQKSQDTPIMGFEQTPEGVMKELIINRGLHYGEALDWINQRYKDGSPFITSLPGIDEFVNSIPGTGQLAARKAMDNVLNIAASGVKLGSWALGKVGEGPAVPEVLQKLRNISDPLEKIVKTDEEISPSNWKATLLGDAPELAMIFSPASKAAELGLEAVGLPTTGVIGSLGRMLAGGTAGSVYDALLDKPVDKESFMINALGFEGFHWGGEALKAAGKAGWAKVVGKPVVDAAETLANKAAENVNNLKEAFGGPLESPGYVPTIDQPEVPPLQTEPKYKPSVNQQMVVNAPIDIGGAQKYYPPMSKYHLESAGPVGVTSIRLNNPVTVEYGNDAPARALISQLRGNSKLGAAVLHALDLTVNRWGALPQSEVSNNLETIANRYAKRMGYDSIIYRGESADKNIFVDLKNVSALKEAPNELVDKAERMLNAVGRRALRTNALQLGLLPTVGLGLGLGALYDNDNPAHAMDWMPLVKSLAKAISVDDVAESLEPKVEQLLRQGSALSGETKPSKIMAYLSKARDEVHGLSGETKVNYDYSIPQKKLELWNYYQKAIPDLEGRIPAAEAEFNDFQAGELKRKAAELRQSFRQDFPGGSLGAEPDIQPDYIGVTVSHPKLGPFPVVNINGIVDQDTGTWYPRISNSPLGFPPTAMEKVFEKVKSDNPTLVKAYKSAKSLAGILAWTGAAATAGYFWDTVNGKQVQAAEVPSELLLDLFGQGARGVGEDAFSSFAAATSKEDIQNGLHNMVGAAQGNAQSNSAKVLDVGERAGQNYHNLGDLPPEVRRGIGLFTKGENLKSLWQWRPPWSWTDNPLVNALFSRDLDLTQNTVYGSRSTRAQLFKEAEDALGDITPEEEDDVSRSAYGYTTAKDGTSRQTATGIAPEIDSIGKRLHENILAPLWKLNTGVDPRVPAMMQEQGLEENVRNYRIIKALQERDPNNLVNIPGATNAHINVAQQSAGLINTKPWQWQNLAVPFQKAKFMILPIENEKAALTQRISELWQLYGPNPTPNEWALIQPIRDRLNWVEAHEQEVVNASMDQLHPARFGPFDGQAPAVPEGFRENDPARLLKNHIEGALHKFRGDEMYYMAKQVTDALDAEQAPGKSALADSIKQYMNTMSGLKAMRSDARMVKNFNSLLKNVGAGPISIEQYRKFADVLTEAAWVLKLGFGLRFPILHGVLPDQTAAFLGKHLYTALGKIMNNPDIWEEVANANLLTEKAASSLGEVRRSFLPKPVEDVMSYLPDKAINFARTRVYQAAKDYALEKQALGTFKPQLFIRGFNSAVLGSGDAEKIAKEYAAATVRSTQFMYTPQSRPLMLTGGVGTRLVGQFKTFTAAHFDLLANMVSHGRQTGDWEPFARTMLSTMLLGGVGTFGGYEALRHYAISKGYGKWFPEPQAPIGTAMSMAASALLDKDSANAVNDALSNIQLGGSFQLHMPGFNPESLVEFVAGPTIGTIYGAGLGIANKDAQKTLQAISPMGASLIAASQMSGLSPQLNDFYSKMGYRGDIYSPTGKLMVQQPGWATVASRAVNWQPSLRSQRYKYVKDIQSALEGGQMAAAQTMLDEARRRGFIFTKQDFAAIKGQATKARSGTKPNEPLR